MNEMNWGFDEWSTIATIFLSVVAIIIAIWSSRSTSKTAEKQINEIKKLSALQIEISIVELELERIKTGLKENEKRAELKEFEGRKICITSPEQSMEIKAKHKSLKEEIDSLHNWGIRLFKVESELKFLQDDLLKKGN